MSSTLAVTGISTLADQLKLANDNALVTHTGSTGMKNARARLATSTSSPCALQGCRSGRTATPTPSSWPTSR